MKIEIGIKTYMLSDVARSCGGYLMGADRPIKSICTDSREADRATMFVAMRGERVDGHSYIPNVVKAGCRCVLADKRSLIPTAVSCR